MVTPTQSNAALNTSPIKRAHRGMWAAGDYHRFATGTVWELGEVLTAACRIGPGQRVLDVAAGTGNTAIRAAEAGADVVASDLTPENFDAGRREARARGVSLEWVEADAEALPFADGEFDVVTSSVGAMFAPHHRAVADEMLRVCRSGGTIGMINFTPEGLAGEFFPVFAPYLPVPPADGEPPLLWGSEAHVRELFGDRVRRVTMVRREYSEYAASPQAYCAFFKETFGPVASVYSQLAGRPDEVDALDRAFVDFAVRENRGEPGGPARYIYEYLLVTASKDQQALP
ncbi:class I SAM-dependent methyltransferase [Arhodomonas sp. AD133]|uniref:class I SAM-dependent methyltransferase n=1 Tax=Arhodomonas sp. AD133 TaxID=3415009 RepID=UPI003EC14235